MSQTCLQVGDLAVKKIPVHVSVVGTPLVMQLGRVLLPGFPRNPTMAKPQGQFLVKLQSRADSPPGKSRVMGPTQGANREAPAGLALDFGQLLAETSAERTFHVFNTSSLPVQLDWAFHRSPSHTNPSWPDQLVRVCVCACACMGVCVCDTHTHAYVCMCLCVCFCMGVYVCDVVYVCGCVREKRYL